MATAKGSNPFGKKKEGGNFKFQLPDKIGTGRGKIKDGKYIGVCSDIYPDTSKAGNPMWVWGFTVTKGTEAGRDFKLWTVLSDDAAWKLVETFAALGLEFNEGDEITINKKDVIGVGCTLHVVGDKGKDGDQVDEKGQPKFSKLDKISAHPQGAGYRPGKGALAAEVTGEEDDEEEEEIEEEEEEVVDEGEEEDGEEEEEEDEDEDEDEEEEEPAPPPRKKTAAKKAPAKAPARGRAPATLGRGKKK